jgi:RHS repeat-associated protein
LGIRHLFQGQLWTQDTGLNDYRNRVELPTMGVFLQPDPIGFKGDAANLYRFCNNNAVNRTDPMGLFELRGVFLGYAPGEGLEGPGRDLAQRLGANNLMDVLDKLALTLVKTSNIQAQFEGKSNYNVIEIHIGGKEHPDTDNITVMGTYGQPVEVQSKTTADLGLPHASNKDGHLHVDQTLYLNSYFPRGASEALKNEERKRPGSLIGWANDRYPDLVKSLRTTSFKDFGAAEKAVDNAVRKDFNIYLSRAKLDFDFRPGGQPSL